MDDWLTAPRRKAPYYLSPSPCTSVVLREPPRRKGTYYLSPSPIALYPPQVQVKQVTQYIPKNFWKNFFANPIEPKTGQKSIEQIEKKERL